MKDIDETYFNKANLKVHHDKHVAKDESDYIENKHVANKKFPNMSKKEYNRKGHLLSQQPVYGSELSDSHDVIGFMNINGRLVKYRKSTGELVIYVAERSNQATVSYYLTLGAEDGHKRYKNLLKRDYLREIIPEDDYFNGMV